MRSVPPVWDLVARIIAGLLAEMLGCVARVVDGFLAKMLGFVARVCAEYLARILPYRVEVTDDFTAACLDCLAGVLAVNTCILASTSLCDA